MADTADKAPAQNYSHNIAETRGGDERRQSVYFYHLQYSRMLPRLFKCAGMLVFHAPSILVMVNSAEV